MSEKAGDLSMKDANVSFIDGAIMNCSPDFFAASLSVKRGTAVTKTMLMTRTPSIGKPQVILMA